MVHTIFKFGPESKLLSQMDGDRTFYFTLDSTIVPAIADTLHGWTENFDPKWQ